MGQRHPDRAAEPRRLDHQPWIAGPLGKRRQLAEDRVAIRRPACRAHLAPLGHRQADAPGHPLEQRLVHAQRRGRDARARVRQTGGLEERLDRAVLAERPVERDEHDGCRPGRGQAVERRARRERPVGPERARVVVGGAGPVVAAMIRGQPPPAAGEVDQDLLDGVPGPGEGLGDGGPRHDRHVVLGRRPAKQHDDGAGSRSRRRLPGRPVADELDLEAELDAVPGEDLGADALGQACARRPRSPSGR